MKGRKGRADVWFEAKRQGVHAAGSTYALVAYFLGSQAALIAACAVIAAAFFLGFMRSRRIGPFGGYLEGVMHDWITGFERPDEVPLGGLVTFSLGVVVVSALFPAGIVVPAIIVLAAGDSVSTVIGKVWGDNPLFYNRKKSWEGSGAFFFVALAVLLFFVNPMKAVAIAALVSVVEGMPGIDDNITVPLATALLLSI
ncbi:MAG: SEC59/DGK1/VTE5 family protein [Candidatus Aenigmatarchaeota archaeon]